MVSDTSSLAFATPPRRLFWGGRKPRSIGLVSPSYGTEKVLYGLAPAGYSFHKLFRVPLQRLEKKGKFWHNTPIVLDHPVSLVHTLNEIPAGTCPFVVSFENELPRYLGDPPAWQLDVSYRLVEGDRCRQILALSDIAANGLRERLHRRGLERLAHKVAVFRGSVMALPVPIGQARQARPEGPLRLLFVGRYAFRNGLLPTLDALDDCRAQGADVQATVVCDFDNRGNKNETRYVNKAATLERMARMAGLTYYPRLPNAEIHQLMRSHDVLVFPTLDESLGWVAVEAGLAGMPIITTDTYALPELVVHGQTGFLIPLNKNETSRWVGRWLEGKALDDEVEQVFATSRAHLADAILKFFNNSASVSTVGERSRNHISALYEPSLARQKLKAIYDAAIG